jgi:hypothetical protein
VKTIERVTPSFYSELKSVLLRDRADLVAQLGLVAIENGSGDENCFSLGFSEGRPLNLVEKNVIGVRHGETVPVSVAKGMVAIDTDNFGRIRAIEVIGRPELYAAFWSSMELVWK